MLNIIILILLTVILYILVKKILDRKLLDKQNTYRQLNSEYEKLNQENLKLKTENANLEKTTEETIALFDTTKDICKSLDENTVFSHFGENINKYIEVSDCKFIKEPEDLKQYNNYMILPFQIDKQSKRFLVASGIKENDKDKFNILAQQFFLGIKRALLYERVQELAITDSLTGVFSRRYLLERFQEEIERSKKFKYSFSILMLDIDHFKNYNDRYGHLVGDTILRELARTVKENIRQIDLMGRYGGEEFSIILIETDKDQAIVAAERIREATEAKLIKAYDEDLKVTISIGIATFPDDTQEAQVLIDKADWALYRAKQTGRNRVCVYGVYE